MTNETKTVKCVVWDLDDTIWDGVLVEGEVQPRAIVLDIIAELDRRGILQSVASKNDHAAAMTRLAALGIADYFLHPQIHWSSKAASVKRIAERLNIGLDTVAFIDDQPFERGEVSFSWPQVRCIDARDVDDLLARPDMSPRFVTDDSRRRRQMYLDDDKRQQLEDSFTGPKEEFLASLNMRFTIGAAREADLQRAEELTLRTNQLNTTGYTYSYEQLDRFRTSPHHAVLIAELEDRYGSYGKIGLALVDLGSEVWTIKLLLMSCRVMSRGVGTVLLRHIMAGARRAGVRLQAEFVPNDRNRIMYLTYKFEGFRELEPHGRAAVLEHDLARVEGCPPYIELRILDDEPAVPRRVAAAR